MRRDQLDARILSQWMSSIHQTAGRQGEEKYFVVRLAEPPLGAASTEKGMVDQSEPMTDTSIKQGEPPLIVFNCGMCSKAFRVSQRFIGKAGKCKNCGHFQVVRETQQV
jgi:DNA-directed RNA polymerase subunit RPC12/RpoP